MVKDTIGPRSLMLICIAAVASIAFAQDATTTPKITSVSTITTAEHQTITITGTGFGTHKAYTGDSDYISLYDSTKKWEAGYAPDLDTVTLIVNSWTNTKITLGGFAGKWGTQNFTLAAGNKELVKIWNAQSGAGPASKTVTIAKAATSTELRSSKSSSVYGEPVTFTAVVTSGDGVPRDGEKVQFLKGDEVLGSGTLEGGVARFTTTQLDFGANTIRAVFAGNDELTGTGREEESARIVHTVE